MSSNSSQSKVVPSSNTQQIDTFDATDHCKPIDDKVDKRSSWEAFEFKLLESGNVEVVNCSHENPEEHTYVVVMDSDGVPKWCLKKSSDDSDDWSDCPSRKFGCSHSPSATDDAPHEVCKHSWGVAKSQPLVRAVRAQKSDNDD